MKRNQSTTVRVRCTLQDKNNFGQGIIQEVARRILQQLQYLKAPVLKNTTDGSCGQRTQGLTTCGSQAN
jgi:hypothetical protein